MERRAFMGVTGGVGAAAALAGCTKETGSAAPSVTGSDGKLAGMTLEQLREVYRHWLYDDFLPFMDNYVIDHDLGGFMCAVDRDGTQVNSDKRGWYEGRGIWTYSFLYNKVAKEQKYLDVASKSVNFIMKYKPSGDNLWPEYYKKDGANDGRADTRLYGDLFIALGLQEFSKASGNDRYWDIAKEAILKDVRLYDRPDYQKTGQRQQGVWMCLINTVGNALEHKQDAELEKVMDRSLDAILNHHYDPDFQLNHEVLKHDLTIEEISARSAFLGHAIETFWMIMYEAVRRKDKKLFDTAAERFRRHVEVGWDDVYGGIFESLDNVDDNRFSLRKVLWLQVEALIGSLCVIEHTGAPWAKEWFERMWIYVMDKFPLKKYGYPLWLEWGDRKATYTPHTARCEHFHHPRHLMQNMLALDRMIGRGGKISNVFA